MAVGVPATQEYAPYFAGYVARVPEPDVLAALASQIDVLRRLADSLPPDRETYSYEPGKWSVREVIGHIGDGERVFGYRASSFSRGDRNQLPGFDEKTYVANSRFREVPVAELVGEFVSLREANLAFLRRLDESQWTRSGTANNAEITVRALAYIMAGHVRHHLEVLRTRYGVA